MRLLPKWRVALLPTCYNGPPLDRVCCEVSAFSNRERASTSSFVHQQGVAPQKIQLLTHMFLVGVKQFLNRLRGW